MFFSPFIAKPRPENAFVAERRTFPVDFCYPRSIQTRTFVRLPSGLSVTDLPADITQTIPDGSFTRRIKATAGIIDVRSKLDLQKPLFTVGEYAELKKMFAAMTASFADKIAVSGGR